MTQDNPRNGMHSRKIQVTIVIRVRQLDVVFSTRETEGRGHLIIIYNTCVTYSIVGNHGRFSYRDGSRKIFNIFYKQMMRQMDSQFRTKETNLKISLKYY